MIVVGGKEFITLDDEFFVNGQKVKKAYVNGSLVYPEIMPGGSVAVCSGKTTISFPGSSFPPRHETRYTAYLDGGATYTAPTYTFTGSFISYIFHNGGIKGVDWCGFIPFDSTNPDNYGYPIGWPGDDPRAYGLNYWPNSKLITGKYIDAQLNGRWENHDYYDNAEIYTFIKYHAPAGHTIGSSGYYQSTDGLHGEWYLKSLNNRGAAKYNDQIIVLYQTHDNRWAGTWYYSICKYTGSDMYVPTAWTGETGNELSDAVTFWTDYDNAIGSEVNMVRVMPQGKDIFHYGVQVRGKLDVTYERDFEDYWSPLNLHEVNETLTYTAGFIPINRVHYIGPLEDVPESINKGNRMFQPLKWFDPSELNNM